MDHTINNNNFNLNTARKEMKIKRKSDQCENNSENSENRNIQNFHKNVQNEDIYLYRSNNLQDKKDIIGSTIKNKRSEKE